MSLLTTVPHLAIRPERLHLWIPIGSSCAAHVFPVKGIWLLEESSRNFPLAKIISCDLSVYLSVCLPVLWTDEKEAKVCKKLVETKWYVISTQCSHNWMFPCLEKTWLLICDHFLISFLWIQGCSLISIPRTLVLVLITKLYIVWRTFVLQHHTNTKSYLFGWSCARQSHAVVTIITEVTERRRAPSSGDACGTKQKM
jgi:hypothetical protein